MAEVIPAFRIGELKGIQMFKIFIKNQTFDFIQIQEVYIVSRHIDLMLVPEVCVVNLFIEILVQEDVETVDNQLVGRQVKILFRA
jgi:hypothetical protein